MFVRCRKRFKDGREHRCWSVVESRRRRDGRVVQRQVPHLGEINDGQRAAWCRAVEVVREGSGAKPMALFAEDREAPELACETVGVKVGELVVRRPRQWGACCLALELSDRLELDRFWGPQFGHSRDKRPDCVQVVIGLVVTPQGFPLAYETMPGNTSGKSTLADFLAAIAHEVAPARHHLSWPPSGWEAAVRNGRHGPAHGTFGALHRTKRNGVLLPTHPAGRTLT